MYNQSNATWGALNVYIILRYHWNITSSLIEVCVGVEDKTASGFTPLNEFFFNVIHQTKFEMT
jgi:hypothetical protein